MNKFKKLELELLNKKTEQFFGISNIVPSNGWIKTIRKALKIPTSICAKKLKLSEQTFHSYEKAEIRGGITINSLKKAADSMGCKLIYALVPKEGNFDKMLQTQAIKKAKQMIELSHHSMALENQSIETLEKSMESLVNELLDKHPINFWNE